MIVGITGHQDLGSAENIAWVSGALEGAILGAATTQGISCLAIGADQLFASLLQKHGIPYSVIVPCRKYENTFTTREDLERYRSLLASATEATVLPFDAPQEQAYWEAGKEVAARSEKMFAVWNGLQSRGLGGTADIVKFSLEKGRNVMHFNLAKHTIAILDA